MRGSGRALLSSKPRRRGGADGVLRQPAALYEPADGVPLPQGVRAGLLVQAGGIRSGRAGEEGRGPCATPGPRRSRRLKEIAPKVTGAAGPRERVMRMTFAEGTAGNVVAIRRVGLDDHSHLRHLHT